jgi:hypothetical protein
MPGLKNLSLRRKLQSAQTIPQIDAVLLFLTVDGGDVVFHFNQEVTTGGGTVKGTIFALFPVEDLEEQTITKDSPTTWRGTFVNAALAGLGWVSVPGNWKTPSNGRFTGNAGLTS